MLTYRPFRGTLFPSRSSSTPRGTLRGQIPQIQRRFRGGTPSEGPSTFDPARLRPSDYLDVAGMTRRTIVSPKEFLGRRPKIAYLTGFSSSMDSTVRTLTRFPPGTQGFLYYHPSTDPPPLDEGHLRFRITQSSDPATFSHGKDLLYPSGEPWNLPGGRIAVSEVYNSLRRVLLNDGLVTEAQLDEWGSRYDAGRRLSDVLHNLEEPFTINFAHETHTFTTPTFSRSRETPRWTLIHPLTVREGHSHVSLCTGRAICRLEAATFQGKKKSWRVVVMRLLRVLNALEPSEEALERGINFHRPEEGELFRTPLTDQTWTRTITKNALHALWERASKKETGVRTERGK